MASTRADDAEDARDRKIMRYFIGSNARPYMRVYRRIQEEDGLQASWNWGFFLLGLIGLSFLWAFYRKWYLVALALWIGPILVSFLVPPTPWGVALWILCWLAFHIFMSIFVNYFYLKRAEGLIEDLREESDSSSDFKDGLASSGGVSWVIVLIFLAFHAFVIFLSITVFLAAFFAAFNQELKKRSHSVDPPAIERTIAPARPRSA